MHSNGSVVTFSCTYSEFRSYASLLVLPSPFHFLKHLSYFDPVSPPPDPPRFFPPPFPLNFIMSSLLFPKNENPNQPTQTPKDKGQSNAVVPVVHPHSTVPHLLPSRLLSSPFCVWWDEFNWGFLWKPGGRVIYRSTETLLVATTWKSRPPHQIINCL